MTNLNVSIFSSIQIQDSYLMYANDLIAKN